MFSSLSRRQVLKSTIAIAALAPFAGITRWSKAFGQAVEKKLIDMTGKKRKDPENKAAVAIAKGFGYIDNHEKEKSVGGVDKTSAKGTKFAVAQQFCHNCQYAPEAQKQKDGYVCLLIANVLVNHNGWCRQWNPRQDA